MVVRYQRTLHVRTRFTTVGGRFCCIHCLSQHLVMTDFAKQLRVDSWCRHNARPSSVYESHRQNKNRPQIVGLGSPMCWRIFFATNIMRIHQFKVLFHMLPFGCNLKGRFEISNSRRLRGVLGGWDLYQSKAHPGLSNTYQYKVLL